MKIIITYKTAFWREDGYSGSAVDAVSLVSCVYDACAPRGDAALVVFIVGRAAMDWNERSEGGLLLIMTHILEKN